MTKKEMAPPSKVLWVFSLFWKLRDIEWPNQSPDVTKLAILFITVLSNFS